MEAKELFNLSTYFRSYCCHETVKKPVCISCSNKGFLLLVTAKTDVVAKGQLHRWSKRAEQKETLFDSLDFSRGDIPRDHIGAAAQNNTI